MCYFNLDNFGYKVVSNRTETEFGFSYTLQRKSHPGPFNSMGSPDIDQLVFSVEMRSNDVLRFKVTSSCELLTETSIVLKSYVYKICKVMHGKYVRFCM